MREQSRPSVRREPADYRALMKKVEQVVGEIEHSDDIAATVRTVADSIVEQFHDDLGLFGGRLYQKEGDDYVLQAIFGGARDVPMGIRVPASYPPVELVLSLRSLHMAADDPRLDADLEKRLGVDEFAAIEVGDGDYILSFNVEQDHDPEQILYSLGILRFSINQKIRQDRMEEVFRQARRIQASILPRRIPKYGDFDLFGRSEPMESVGGDHYDYIPITDKILGLAIADVSGHGLPAALQVRDIYMGMRMGGARDFKIVRTVELLNSIIHKSTLTSRFVSMFYGELELNGLFIYVNAGHPAPFHLAADGQVRPLEEGGAVLGPLPNATYERGFVWMKPGDLILLYTDGIIETRGGGADGTSEYGTERLLETARENQSSSALEIVEAIFRDLEAFSGGRPPQDDRTVVVVRRPA